MWCFIKRKGNVGDFYPDAAIIQSADTHRRLELPIKRKESEKIKTSLKCPSCGSGDVLVEMTSKCIGAGSYALNATWNGGTFTESIDKIDTVEYCPAEGV